jgi:Na+/H+-dicarboxylate symporter
MQSLLTKGFARLIPLFVLGFAAQMTNTGLLSQVVETYTMLLLALVGFIALYLSVLFFLSAGGSLSKTFSHIKSLLPAGGLALTSGCSLSTMPWTIAGASKNMNDPELAKAVIPATTNIQQVGDAIANAFFCFLIYTHFFGKTPDPMLWLTFSIVFMLARFATAAMLGGAIFVMLPIYESYLHFNGEMIALVLALNVVFDPIVTSSNVMANGALCRVFERVWQRLNRKSPLNNQRANASHSSDAETKEFVSAP